MNQVNQHYEDDFKLVQEKNQIVQQYLISDLANVVDEYSTEMWLFSTPQTKYLYRSQRAAVNHACEWMYKNINDILGPGVYYISKNHQDYFIVENRRGVNFALRLKETLQNDYDKLHAIYSEMGRLNPVVEQLFYYTKDS